MTRPNTLTIALPIDQIEAIEAAVAAGRYESPAEIVREAVADWREKEIVEATADERLRRAWDEGIASGPGRFADIEEIKAEARRRSRATGRRDAS